MISNNENLATIIRTMLINGFHLDRVIRPSTIHAVLHTHKIDSLGANIKYSILVCDGDCPEQVFKPFGKDAIANGSYPIGIGPIMKEGISWMTLDEFMAFLGGPVSYYFLALPNLPELLERLGYNSLPKGMQGDPQDILEDLTLQSLQFLLANRGRRFGSERRFEKLPDGIAFDGINMILLFDAKAYSAGYDISADDIRRFSSYVNDFHDKYKNDLGNIFSFVIVSSKFNQNIQARRIKCSEMYAKCGVNLTCLETRELGEIVKLVMKYYRYRGSIQWKNIFSDLDIKSSAVNKQIVSLRKDNLGRN